MAKEMELDRAPIEFKPFYFFHVLVVPPKFINYQLLPPQVSYILSLTQYRASSSRNAQLSQLDLVYIWAAYYSGLTKTTISETSNKPYFSLYEPSYWSNFVSRNTWAVLTWQDRVPQTPGLPQQRHRWQLLTFCNMISASDPWIQNSQEGGLWLCDSLKIQKGS